jgi:hypothetical protein
MAIPAMIGKDRANVTIEVNLAHGRFSAPSVQANQSKEDQAESVKHFEQSEKPAHERSPDRKRYNSGSN